VPGIQPLVLLDKQVENLQSRLGCNEPDAYHDTSSSNVDHSKAIVKMMGSTQQIMMQPPAAMICLCSTCTEALCDNDRHDARYMQCLRLPA